MAKIFKLLLVLIAIEYITCFYIQTYSSNYTLYNNDQYSPLFQPRYCKAKEDTCEANQKFNISITAQQACTPQQKIEFQINCPLVACLDPSQYLNCTNTFTGVNETKTLLAYITMNSTTNSSHDVVANYTIKLTWVEEPVPPPPPPNPEGNSDLGLIIGIAGGVVGVIIIAVIVIVYRKRKGRRNSQLLSQQASQN